MSTKQKGAGWFTEFMLKGERYRSQFDTFEEGERWELDVRHAVKMGRTAPQPKNGGITQGGGRISTIGELFDYTLKHHYKVKAPRSYDWAETNLRQVREYLGDSLPVSAVDYAKLEEMAQHFRDTGNSDSTVNRKLAVTSKALSIAVDLGVVDRKAKIPLTKERKGRVRFLTKDEEVLVLGTLRQWGDEDLFDLVACAIDTGARQGELFKAQWQDISPKFATWTFWETKADLPRTIPLTKRVRGILKKRKLLGGKGPFFGMTKYSIRDRWERLTSHLEMDDVVFHTLRHTCASKLAQSGVDLRRIQVWLGHKRIETTLIYAHLAPKDLNVARDALEAA